MPSTSRKIMTISADQSGTVNAPPQPSPPPPRSPRAPPACRSCRSGSSAAPRRRRSEERRVGKESRSRWSPYHSKKKRHTIYWRDWSSDVCSSDLDVNRGHFDAEHLAEDHDDLRRPVGYGQRAAPAVAASSAKSSRTARLSILPFWFFGSASTTQIGRASCRERE